MISIFSGQQLSRKGDGRRQRGSRQRKWLRRFERLEDRSLLATFTVNSLLDTVDANPGDGLAQDAAGLTTLRAAVMEANARAGDDEIVLPAGIYTLSLAGAGEDAAATGDLDVAAFGRLTITGDGASASVIDAAALGDRVFHVLAFANLTISGATIRNGSAAADGGGAFNSGTLAIANSVVTGNTATRGGGVFNGGTLTISASTISDNSATGGGIYNAGPMATITNSTISGNTSGAASDSVSGGIHNEAGTLTVMGSTISGNAGQNVGGIFNNAALSITSSTVTANTASVPDGGPVNGSGGIVNSPSRSVTIQNTIVAGNTVNGMGAADFSGLATSLGSNLIGDADGSSGWVASDLVNVDPLLGPLADNGGPTHTHALQTGSPGIDAGNTSGAPVTDQRGVPFVRVFDGSIDIGAYERQSLSLIVDTNADEDDGSHSAGDLSLREAILLANINPGHDTIMGEGAITFSLGELLVTGDLAISGMVLSGNNSSRVFNIATGVAVEISGQTIRNGRAADGGAILNRGALTITSSTITGNTATNAGGGIYNDGGTLAMTNSTVSGNTAVTTGGGLYNDGGALTISGSTVTGNTVTSETLGEGGGVFNRGDLTIQDSRLTHNTAARRGGGIYNDNAGDVSIATSTIADNKAAGFVLGVHGGGIYNRGTATVTASTVSGNSASPEGSSGGGIYNQDGSLNIANSTISGNSANQTGGIFNNAKLTLKHSTVTANSTNMFVGPPSEGSGGIANSPDGVVTVQNTIIAGNTAGTAGGTPDFFGSASSLGDNLVGDTTGSTGWTADDLQNVDPKLGPLGNNGGPTQTHVLLADSPAIDAGNNAQAPANDQRGEPFVRIANGTVDIGAYEIQSFTFVVDTAVDENDGDYTPGDVSLREAILLTSNNPVHDTIAFSQALTGSTITLTMGELLITSDLTLMGLGADQLTISGNNASRIFNIAAGATVEASGLTVRNGRAAKGGGIRNAGTLILDGTVVSGNSLAGEFMEQLDGGAIYNIGTLAIMNSSISANAAPVAPFLGPRGGGIWNSGALSIRDSTISDNSANTSAGGGIYNSESGTLTLIHSEVSGNSSSPANSSGGSVWNGGQLSMRDSTISRNGAGGIRNTGELDVKNSLISENSGAGIWNDGNLSIQDSTISNNAGDASGVGAGIYNAATGDTTILRTKITANTSAGFRGGGGVYNLGSLLVSESTISGNRAPSGNYLNGGGIYSQSGTVTITNSTISGNSAYAGGGIYNNGVMTIRSSTVVDNFTVRGAGNSSSRPGGVANGQSGMLSIQNTIIARNTLGFGFVFTGPDVSGVFNSLGNNLIGDASESSGWVASDLTGSGAAPLDPNLGPLTDNGGPTMTHALLDDSPAIDAGSNAAAPSTDQRGFPRPWDGDQDGQAVADIGAYERTEPVETFTGTESNDVFLLKADESGNNLLVFNNDAGTGAPIFSAPLASLPPLVFDTLAGNDRLIVAADVRFAEFKSGSGSNTLSVQDATARVHATVDADGTLDTEISDGALLITNRFHQSSLTIGAGSRVVIPSDGSDAVTSVLNVLTIEDGATLDINDNALIVDYTGASPAAAIRAKIIEGRGGVGIGNGPWTGMGITSSVAAQANATAPDTHAIGYADNAQLPLGAYQTFRGRPIDDTSILIAYTRTADANLDGVVNDDDVTIAGATYAPGIPQPDWALGDFDYNGFVDDDDVTLLGALYDTSATPPPAPVQQADRSEARAPQPWIAPQRPEPLDAELLDLLAETIAEKKNRRAIFP